MTNVQNYVTKDEELRTALLREIEWRPVIRSRDKCQSCGLYRYPYRFRPFICGEGKCREACEVCPRSHRFGQ